MKEAKERGKDVVGVLLPFISLFDLMCLWIRLKHMGKDHLILRCCTDFVAPSWFTPFLVQPCSP